MNPTVELHSAQQWRVSAYMRHRKETMRFLERFALALLKQAAIHSPNWQERLRAKFNLCAIVDHRRAALAFKVKSHEIFNAFNPIIIAGQDELYLFIKRKRKFLCIKVVNHFGRQVGPDKRERKRNADSTERVMSFTQITLLLFKNRATEKR